MKRLLVVACLAACGTSDPGTAGVDATMQVSPSCMEATQHSDYDWIAKNIFNTCAIGGCHAGNAANADHLSLQQDVAREQLVGKPAIEGDGWARVAPGDPASSYLLVAIGHIDGPLPKDGIMPLQQNELCVEKREAIERWIAAGANP